MSARTVSPTAAPPRPGRQEDGLWRSALRTALALATAGTLVFLFGPAGLASTCTADAPCCSGADRSAPACPGCHSMANGRGRAAALHSAGLDADSVCSCSVGSPAPPPVAASMTEGGVRQAFFGRATPSPAIVTAGASRGTTQSGAALQPPVDPGGPLHLRNRVLRI